jgi:hypothetical protein
MTESIVSAGSTCGQPTDARRVVGDDDHTGTDSAPVPGKVPLETVDILGDFGDGRYVAGNATLAELLGRTFDDSGTPAARAADALELDQLRELGCPAGDLADVALKVAWVLRMDFYGRGDSAYGTATTLLLGSVLSDLLLLRQAEVTRRDLLAAKATGR